ncbi:two component transcriptional regulator, winged helix family [Alloactinosynnema sp. L-07]|uniref:response regulator transcription factor n=1 Tax=Alloactinosynnema sp. L-07 TaxID=1653480 RepID=UPI00065F0AA1|nr:response regulator transcription factor [Alloactinosynnema sp. L-07]CRK56539.1 two component transcriptional regulator, winged helix family [Alloactinosynnema sp. L-07]
MAQILLVAAQPDTESALRAAFRHAGHDLVSTGDPRTGLLLMREFRPDLMVLDDDGPDLGDQGLIRQVRELAGPPMLVLADHPRRTRTLRAADDCVAKPVDDVDVLARAEMMLNRAVVGGEIVDDGVVRVDCRTRGVTVGTRGVELTRIEFDLLLALARHPAAVLTHNQLLATVWNDPTGLAPDRVKFAVLRLRRKLGWAGSDSPISAVRGVGYRYRVQ